MKRTIVCVVVALLLCFRIMTPVSMGPARAENETDRMVLEARDFFTPRPISLLNSSTGFSPLLGLI